MKMLDDIMDNHVQVLNIETSRSDYLSLLKLMPNELGRVLVYNKESGKHEEKNIYRRYRSYLKTPKFQSDIAKSYMFSGSNELEIETNLPKVAKKLKERVELKTRLKFNQCIINWYKDGTEFIEPHSDCDAHMVEDYKIAILSLNDEYESDFFVLSDRGHLEYCRSIKITSGSLIVLDRESNNSYRHHIPENFHRHSPRISLTFRQIK